MSLKIKREAIGDILVDNGNAVVFIYNTVSDVIFSDITKIGQAGVKLAISSSKTFNVIENFKEMAGTVASLRCDCIVSLALNLSREKTVLLIKSIGVEINKEKVVIPSYIMKEGDIFSIRGHGKFILSKIGTETKKKRIHIVINKYI